MAKIFHVFGLEATFTDIVFIAEGETETQSGLFVHYENDEFHDDDCIIGNACTMPEDNESAESILFNEYREHYFVQDDDGVYHLGICDLDELNER